MSSAALSEHRIQTHRHRTAWIEAGPADGPLMIFLHGWPELGIVWRAQLEHFAAAGWRSVAPDLRGYGGSSVPSATSAYALREVVADMIELHDALGGAPAVWAGHDWGSPVVWNLAAHHPNRCRAVANLCVPYIARGCTLPNLVALVDRDLYPGDKYPAGQWDYWLYQREEFAASAHDLEADVAATIATLYRTTARDIVGKPARQAAIRAHGGWFGPAHRAPLIARDEAFITQVDYDAIVAAYKTTGFSGANAWYLNDEMNAAYAAEAPDFGRLSLPVLFIHAAWDVVCNTLHTRLADPMRSECFNLTEIVIEGGHELTLERPAEVNDAIANWLFAQRLG